MNERTPTTRNGLRSYDHLEPLEAIRQAWHEPGAQPEYHEVVKTKVHALMPLLARSLDRLPARSAPTIRSHQRGSALEWGETLEEYEKRTGPVYGPETWRGNTTRRNGGTNGEKQ